MAESSQTARQALAQASGSQEEQAVTFRLKGGAEEKVVSAKETERLSRLLVTKAARACGYEPSKLKILENLGMFTVHAKPELLLRLLDEPEIASARVQQPNSVEMLRPVRKGPVKASGWAE